MADEMMHRGNKIEVKREDGGVQLFINDEEVPLEESPDMEGGYRSVYSFLPSDDPLKLGQTIVDQQLALTNPTLEGLKREDDN